MSTDTTETAEATDVRGGAAKPVDEYEPAEGSIDRPIEDSVDEATEEPTVQPTTERAVEPGVKPDDAAAGSESRGPAPIAAGLVDGEPPRDPSEENALLERWSKIQVSFVKDPHGAVAEADSLITEIVEARRKAFDEHRSSLADRWRESDADTEDLRLLMHDYRKIVNVLFPRQA